MSQLIAGIDGGQSSTAAVVIAGDGSIVGRGTAGPSDHVGEPAGSDRAARACELAVSSALVKGGLAPDAPLAAVGIGLSGYAGAWHGREPAFATRVVRYYHDSVAALAGATHERPAAVVIAGTGSAAFGEWTNGNGTHAGGFGYLFGDEGSSFWIARTALGRAMRTVDRGGDSSLGEAAKAYFEYPDLHAIARAFSLDQITRPQIAGFARVIHNAARLGDKTARAVLDAAAASLAELAVIVVDRLATDGGAPVPVAFVGGGMNDTEFRNAVTRQVAAKAPHARVIAAEHDPAVGAAFLAADAAGIARPDVRG